MSIVIRKIEFGKSEPISRPKKRANPDSKPIPSALQKMMTLSPQKSTFKSFFELTNRSFDTNKVSIAIDWLQLYGTVDIERFPIPESLDQENLPAYDFDTITMVHKGTRTQFYQNLWEVIADGEVVGSMETHPVKVRSTFVANQASFKFVNHLMYCDYWHDVLQALKAELGFRVGNITRLDIAMDGLNPINEFLNAYQRQTAQKEAIDKIGKRTQMSAYNFDDRSKTFGRFTVGSPKSGKYVSVYDKSKELETSNKTYIKHFWEKAGMDVATKNYRVEFRLHSEEIKKLKIDVDYLALPEYLASICKSAANKFFEWRWKIDDANISRWPKVNLIDWDALDATLLERAMKPETADRYKAKLSVHLVENHLYLGKVKEAQIESEKEHVAALLERFELHGWYNKCLPTWQKECERLIRKGSQINQLVALCNKS